MQEIGWAGLGVIPTLDARKLDRDVDSAMSRAGTSGGRIFGRNAGKSAGGTFGRAFRGTLGALGVFRLGSSALRFLGDSVQEGRESVRVAAQSRAVIKSTGGVARVSEKHMGKYAGTLSRIAGIDDELIQQSGNVLLTFKNIRNEQGENNKIFDKGQKAALNLSVALGKDLNSSALMVGKALNDPVAGMTALGRAGVQFSQDQKDAIKKMVESGDTLGAQKAILRELNDEFRGSARAQRTEADRLSVSWGNFKEEIGTELIPVLDDLSRWFRKDGIPRAKEFFHWVRDDGIPMAKDFATWAGDAADKVGDLIGFLDDLPKPAKIAGITALLGAFGASKLRGGGGGALGTAGKVLGLTRPVPVFVTNKGFGGVDVGGGGKSGVGKAVRNFGPLAFLSELGFGAAVAAPITLGVGHVLDKSGDANLLGAGSGGSGSLPPGTFDMSDLDGKAKEFNHTLSKTQSLWVDARLASQDYAFQVKNGIPRSALTTVTDWPLWNARAKEYLTTILAIRDAHVTGGFSGEGSTTPGQVPNHSGPSRSSGSGGPTSSRGVQVHIHGDVRPNSPKEFYQDLQKRSVAAGSDGWVQR